MTDDQSTSDWSAWLKTPAGQQLLAWEQAHFDREVPDLFGFHAVQWGMPGLNALRLNRIAHPILALDARSQPLMGKASRLYCDPEALPFSDRSLDLVVMPHTLDRAVDPHLVLAEAARVLRPEGRLVLTGFNPVSLFGVRLSLSRVMGRLGWQPLHPLAQATQGPIGYWRLKDWLRLLGLELESRRLGGDFRGQGKSSPSPWRPQTWGMFGAVYGIVAVKRVRGMRLVGLARRAKALPAGAPATLAQRQTPRSQTK